MSVLVCDNLTKLKRKKEIIKNFSYNFLDNQIYAIVGKSDSGQENLLNLICCRTKANNGVVYLDGKELYNNNKINDRICFVSKTTSFPGHISIKDIFGIMSSYYPKWDNAYAYELINHFEIKLYSKYKKLPQNKKSLLIGILGLASRANITVFEDPVAYADIKDRYEYFEYLYYHHQRYPRTIIISTNLIDEIDYLIDRVLLLDKGRLIATFKIRELKDNFRYLTGKTEVLKSLITGVKVIGVEERGKMLTVCIRQKLSKDEIRKYQKYLIKISEVPIQNIFIYLINLREKKGML